MFCSLFYEFPVCAVFPLISALTAGLSVIQVNAQSLTVPFIAFLFQPVSYVFTAPVPRQDKIP